MGITHGIPSGLMIFTESRTLACAAIHARWIRKLSAAAESDLALSYHGLLGKVTQITFEHGNSSFEGCCPHTAKGPATSRRIAISFIITIFPGMQGPDILHKRYYRYYRIFL
jgi:hypothetical protein